MARSASAPDAPVRLGHVGKPHGLGGEARVFPDSLEASVWDALLGETVFVSHDERDFRPLTLESFRPHGPVLLVAFEELATREDVESIRDAGVYVDRTRLPDLEPDMYYACDLQGLEVVHAETGEPLGRVESVDDQGPQAQLIVRRPGGGTFRLPFVAAIVRETDLEKGRLTATPPPGLIELNDPPSTDEDESA